jgi:hypothetical protein
MKRMPYVLEHMLARMRNRQDLVGENKLILFKKILIMIGE